MSEGLYVLSLFDGISGGQLALKKAGIKVAKYYASEIEKQPIWITRKNFPNTIHLGDVNNFMQWDIDWENIDLLIGGSPCTDLSIANKNGKGLQGTQSKLFFKYLEILGWLKQINPNVKFLLENVASMKNENKELITKYLKEKDPTTDVVMIDSALISAQRRKRLYWHNFGVEITQPADKGLVLKDILVSAPQIQGEMLNSRVIKNLKTPDEKSKTLTISIDKGEQNDSMTTVPVKHEPNRLGGFYGQTTRWGIWDKENQAPTLTAAMGEGGGHVPFVADKLETIDTITPFMEKSLDKLQEKYGEVPPRFNPYNGAKVEDKLPALTTTCGSQTGSSAVIMFEPTNETNYKDQFKQTSEEPKENSKDTARIGNIGSNAQAHRVYSVRGKSVNLSSQAGGQGAKTGLYKIDLPDGDYTIRKLTPIECERLQTLPDNYTALGIDEQGKEVKISNSARYKAIGNGWTTDVIAYIFSFLPDELKNK